MLWLRNIALAELDPDPYCYGTVTLLADLASVHFPSPDRRMSLEEPTRQRFQQETEEICTKFGAMIRARRKELGMTQDEVALASGVSRRFVIEIEAGRPTCELGRSLMVASVVGLRPTEPSTPVHTDSPMLPEILDESSEG